MSMLIQPIYEISSSLDLYPFSLSASQCWSDLTAVNCVNNPFDTMEDASPNSTKEWTQKSDGQTVRLRHHHSRKRP